MRNEHSTPRIYTSIHGEKGLVVSGSRDWMRSGPVRTRLEKLPKDVEIIEGGAEGLDSVARREATWIGLDVITVHANWKRYGLRAGPIRNRKMLDLKPDLLIAFHSDIAHSKGTKDIVTEAKKRGIPVELIT